MSRYYSPHYKVMNMEDVKFDVEGVKSLRDQYTAVVEQFESILGFVTDDEVESGLEQTRLHIKEAKVKNYDAILDLKEHINSNYLQSARYGCLVRVHGLQKKIDAKLKSNLPNISNHLFTDILAFVERIVACVTIFHYKSM